MTLVRTLIATCSGYFVSSRQGERKVSEWTHWIAGPDEDSDDGDCGTKA